MDVLIMKLTPQEKRFLKTVKFELTSMGRGVGFYRGKGVFYKEVELEDVQWLDKARDIDEHAVKKATFADEFEKIKTETIWSHFFDRYASEWEIFKLPLETKTEIHTFDLKLLELIKFRNRSEMMPNLFQISKVRKYGENHRTKILVVNGKRVVFEPLAFRFAIKLKPKLEQTSLTVADIGKMGL